MIIDIKTFEVRVCLMPDDLIKKIQLDIIQEHELEGWDFCSMIWIGLYEISFQFVRRGVTQLKTESLKFKNEEEFLFSQPEKIKNAVNRAKKLGGWNFIQAVRVLGDIQLDFYR